MTDRGRPEPADTRENLLVISTGLFARRGFDAVGVSEVCSACGITKPTLYYHFGNKDGLLSAVCDRAAGLLLEHLGAAVEYKGDIHSEIPSLFRLLWDFAEKKGDEFRIITDSFHTGPESSLKALSRTSRGRIAGALTSFFRDAAVQHGNIRGKEELRALAFIGIGSLYYSIGDWAGSESSTTDAAGSGGDAATGAAGGSSADGGAAEPAASDAITLVDKAAREDLLIRQYMYGMFT